MSYEYKTKTAGLIDEETRKLAEMFTASNLLIELQSDEHIATYNRRLEFAKNNPDRHIVNVTETTRLLKLWEDMKGKGWSQLTNAQKDELLDALVSSGHFD